MRFRQFARNGQEQPRCRPHRKEAQCYGDPRKAHLPPPRSPARYRIAEAAPPSAGARFSPPRPELPGGMNPPLLSALKRPATVRGYPWFPSSACSERCAPWFEGNQRGENQVKCSEAEKSDDTT